LTLLEPRHHIFNILAIDGSPSADVTADAVVFQTIDELKAGNVTGKIVILVEAWNGYGATVPARGAGVIAAKGGAVALLIRSVTPYSLYTPHTGSGDRGVNLHISTPSTIVIAAGIPAACLTIEEAEMLSRIHERGQNIRIHLRFSSHDNGTVTSRNTIFDVTGMQFGRIIL
jgi:carboxypeptidase Q